MKQELPIAITLLAAGCLLWFWQSNETSKASAAVEQATSATENQQSREPLVGKPTSSSDLQISGVELLKHISESFRDGPPVFGHFEVTSYLFEKTQSIKAGFWNQGQGTGQSRMELILNSPYPVKLTQICDGRFLYRLTEQQNKRRLKFHDLQRLHNEDAGIVESTLSATWVGSGSLDSLFANLSEAFEFSPAKSVNSDQQLIEFTGTWNPTHLSKLMINRVDHREVLPTPKWTKLPPNLPHGVRMRFANTSENGWQPAEIAFFKFDQDDSHQPTVSMSIKFGQVHQQSISPKLFQLEFDEPGAVDETDIYNEHIDSMIGSYRLAEKSGDSAR